MDEDKVQFLLEAVEAEDEAAMLQCLDAGANVDSIGYRYSSYCVGRSTALHFSASAGSFSIARLLLDKNANINIPDDEGYLPLHYALKNGDDEIARLLLDRGADPNLQHGSGEASLHIFNSDADEEMIALLLDHGADVNVQDKFGQTPLHIAAFYGCLKVAQLFVNRNANVNIQTNLLLETPLHVAMRNHNDGVSKLLMENGADLNLLGFLAVKSFLESLNYRDDKDLLMTYLIAGGYIPNENLQYFDCHYNHIDREVQTVLMRCCNHYFMQLDHVGWERPVLSAVHTPYYKKAKRFLVQNQDSYKPYRDSLVKEVKEMKQKKIGRNTIYDVFAKVQNPTYVCNSQLEQAIKSPELEEEFPLYTSLLRITFTKAKPRKMLLERAMEVFTIPVPIVCRMKILSLLGNGDLENVITSYKT